MSNYNPLMGDFVTTLSFTRGRVFRIENNPHGCVLHIKCKDKVTGEARNVLVSSRAIIRVVRGADQDFAVMRGVHKDVLHPMSASIGENEYRKYFRNRPSLQDTHTIRDKAPTGVPVSA